MSILQPFQLSIGPKIDNAWQSKVETESSAVEKLFRVSWPHGCHIGIRYYIL